MNVLQMYWLRYGGHAAFQTKDVAKLVYTKGQSKLPPGPMLQSAEDLGMRVIAFSDPERLERELETLGLVF